MSQLVQTPPRQDSAAGVRVPIPVWQTAVLVALLLLLYWPTLVRLVSQLETSDYSHGFVVPFFSAYILWQERHRLGRLPLQPSWSGLVVLVLAICVLALGRLGAELFLARFSLLLVLAGLTVLFAGWRFFRAVLFPWAVLLLMIPIPALILSQITFPLQLLVSRISAETLALLDVPVLLQGNILQLAVMPLDVAEACSGIRSLMALLTLAIIYGYFMEKRVWVRWLLALASVPIAVAANSVRVLGTAMMVQNWGPDMAKGATHTFWGLMVYVVSLILFYALHRLIQLVWPDRGHGEPDSADALDPHRQIAPSLLPPFIAAAVLIGASALLLEALTRNEVLPPHLALQSFPQQLGGWTGTDVPIGKAELEVLGPGEFLERDYKRDADGVNFFIAFFPTQRTNDTPHSPQHCLPGSGWTPVENKRILLNMAGHAPFPANRYVIAQGDVRKVVLYWFWAHDRGIASEFWFKYYLVRDSLKLHRSDGALIRVVASLGPDETVDQAQQRLLAFTNNVLPLMNDYIPR